MFWTGLAPVISMGEEGPGQHVAGHISRSRYYYMVRRALIRCEASPPDYRSCRPGTQAPFWSSHRLILGGFSRDSRGGACNDVVFGPVAARTENASVRPVGDLR